MEQVWRDAVERDRALDIFFKIGFVRFLQTAIRCREANSFAIESIEKEARGHLRIDRIALNARFCRKDIGEVDLFFFDAYIELGEHLF